MFARTRSSLTAGGPTCLISIFSTTTPICAASSGSQPDASVQSSSEQRHRNNFIQLIVNRCILRADPGSAFKTCIGSQKGQVNVPSWTISLFGNQQIHRNRVRFTPVLFILIVSPLLGIVRVGFVQQPNHVSVLFDGARFAQVRQVRLSALVFFQ